MDYFKIATDICRKDAERLRRGEPLGPLSAVPLARAMLCITCEAISVLGPTCPNCAGKQLMPLATWMRTVASEPKATAP